MSEALQITIEAAKKGAEKALSYFHHQPKVTKKSDNSPVTIADQETEATIKTFLLNYDTNAQFVGEETGGNLDDADAWIIDPIDGTKNFIRSLPFWSILIARYTKGEVTLGVSYTPQMDELIYAEKGKGAYRNGEKIAVSHIQSMADAFLSYTANPVSFPRTDSVTKLLNACMSWRGFGDAFAYQLLASGRIDINIENNVSVWDVAPFAVIIPEAGGTVTNFLGKPWSITDDTIVASNGRLHEEVIEILSEK